MNNTIDLNRKDMYRTTMVITTTCVYINNYDKRIYQYSFDGELLDTTIEHFDNNLKVQVQGSYTSQEKIP